MSTPSVVMAPATPPPPPTHHVYVLSTYIDGRAVMPLQRNAADQALRHQYALDSLAAYPALRDHLEEAILQEATHRREMQRWASDTLDRIALGQPVKFRPRLAQVLEQVWLSRRTGITRKEVSEVLDRDGGPVSGALTALHQGGVIVPLTERR